VHASIKGVAHDVEVITCFLQGNNFLTVNIAIDKYKARKVNIWSRKLHAMVNSASTHFQQALFAYVLCFSVSALLNR